MKSWRKGIASWRIGRRLYLSVPFTWLLPEARKMAQTHNGPVSAGGPAVDLMPDVLADVARLGGEYPGGALAYHNPAATFTTRGCINACPFCAVPKIEGAFRELEHWRPAPLVCDNNLLAASQGHFNRVIDSLKGFPLVDFNQGLDARLFKPWHARKMAELKGVKIRFSFDHWSLETRVADAIRRAQKQGLNNISVYVLIGFKDTPGDALSRLDQVRKWGAWPNPMRYQPLNALSKNSYLAPGWTEAGIRKTMKYYSRLIYTGKVPFDEYRPTKTAYPQKIIQSNMLDKFQQTELSN